MKTAMRLIIWAFGRKWLIYFTSLQLHTCKPKLIAKMLISWRKPEMFALNTPTIAITCIVSSFSHWFSPFLRTEHQRVPRLTSAVQPVARRRPRWRSCCRPGGEGGQLPGVMKHHLQLEQALRNQGSCDHLNCSSLLAMSGWWVN